MRLLVAGADRVDAGKTTFSVGLVERTGAVGFKPRAGNDSWFHHDDYRHAVEQGRLFGADARRLAEASPGSLAPEDINAIHRLWRPTPRGGTGLLGRDDREFLIDRADETYVVNETVELPATVRERLPVENAVGVESLAAFNDVMERHHLPAQRRLAETIESTERAVVESYGDVARPYGDVDPDAVAVVEPMRARIYDGRRYEKACSVATGTPGEGQLEERTEKAVELIEPAATVELPPLGGDEQADSEAVATAYSEAYDAMLATASD